MKKVLSIVLSLVLVICMMPVMAFAGTNDAVYFDITGEKCEGAVNVLSALGVVDGYTDGTYKPAKVVTRAEMAKLIITALGMESYATATQSSYSDMANAKWAIPVVEYATNLGIIQGVGGGRFSPNNPVTYEQAVTMIVRAIGFTTDCNEMNGTWPAIYVQKATALGLFENVDGNNYGTGANRGDVAIMLYNALNTPMVYADKDGATLEKTGKDGSNVTMMKTLNKGGTVEYGVLTATDADDALTNVRSLIGAAGKIIKNKDGKVLSVGEIQTQFLTGKYKEAAKKFVVDDVEYNIDVAAVYTTYPDKTVDKVESTKAAVPAIVNGADESKSAALADGKTYTIAAKVSGKTIKNIYSIASWNEKTNGAVDKVTTSQLKKITSDKSLLNYKFPKNDEGNIDTSAFILNGVKDLSDIKADNIVAVYATTDAVITKVEVGTETVTGKVTKIKTGTDPVYTVDGKEYKVSALKGATVSLKVGDEATLYLDYAGKIYSHGDVVSDSNYGIVLVIPGKDGGSFSDTYKVKLFTEKGEAEILTFKNKAASDDATGAVGDLVEYKLNADGKVNTMKKVDAANDPAGSKYSNGVIAGKICADDIVAFAFDGSDSANAESYKVIKAEEITENITTGVYATNSKDYITAILTDEDATNAVDLFGFINSKSMIKNAKDDPAFEITGVANGNEFTEETKDRTATYDADMEDFSLIEMTGGVVTSVTALVTADITEARNVVDTLVKGDIAMYVDGGTTKTLGVLKAYEVTKVDGDRVQVNGAYQTVKNATVYIPTLDNDDAFKAWTTKSLDEAGIDDGGYVVLIQTNKKSSNWDTVIYVPYETQRDGAILS